MRKVLLAFLSIILLCSCTSKNDINQDYEVVCKNVDMSCYDGVNSTNHCFKLVKTDEVYNVIDNKSSAVFFLGKKECSCCQELTKYLNEVALELGVTIYYIDVFNEEDPLVVYEDSKGSYTQSAKKLEACLYDILEPNPEGKRSLLTPHLFAIINGEFKGSEICTDFFDYDWENTTDKDINNVKKAYRKVLEPFA